jgi:hypothetical protein
MRSTNSPRASPRPASPSNNNSIELESSTSVRNNNNESDGGKNWRVIIPSKGTGNNNNTISDGVPIKDSTVYNYILEKGINN